MHLLIDGTSEGFDLHTLLKRWVFAEISTMAHFSYLLISLEPLVPLMSNFSK
jgi:hypothetical protein